MRFLSNKNILLVSPNDWGKMHVSKHHYAIELAKNNNKVYFLNPPNIKSKLFSIKRVDEYPNLFIITYNPIFRGYLILPRFISDFLVKLQILLIKQFCKIKFDIVWSFTSTYFTNLNWFKVKFKIFHPVDEFIGKEGSAIAESSDLIITVSQKIKSQIEPLKNSNIPIIIDHGLSSCFVEKSTKNLTNNISIDNPDKRENKKINIGYVGNLFSEWLDRSVIKQIINENNNIQFTFWGPFDPSQSNVSAWLFPESIEFISFLKSSPNVILKGSVSPEILAADFQTIDAFIICYKRHEENSISNSHKIIEYLSTGKPIISTKLERYENVQDGLLFSLLDHETFKFPKLFSEVIENIKENSSEKLSKYRINFALERSYKNHLIKIDGIISDILQTKK